METSKYDSIASALSSLKVDATSSEIASWALQNKVCNEELDKVLSLVTMLAEKKQTAVIETLKKMSRLPQVAPKTFDNFNCRDLGSEAKKSLLSLRSLAFIEAKNNVIMVGPTGTGKTHLAQAIGNECCEKGMKAYYIKFKDLKEKFVTAIAQGTTGRLINALAKYSCLIVDEVGYGSFDDEETMLFFHLVDKIKDKQQGTIVLTSNTQPSEWNKFFSHMDALECAMDRIWEDAICITFTGDSYRTRSKISMKFDFNGGLHEKFPSLD